MLKVIKNALLPTHSGATSVSLPNERIPTTDSGIKTRVLGAIILLAISVTWCEVGYYYFILYHNCLGWPGPYQDTNLTRILVLADTHIMGSIKSSRVDKLRREWQMKQAYRISTSIFKPDIVIFLGDIFDEGSFSPDGSFLKACDDFDRIFSFDDNTHERIIIPGNHDVGFHNHMKSFPYLMQRFKKKYRATSSVELINSSKSRNLNIIAINSMSFYNDTCPFCTQSIAATNQIADYLGRQRDKQGDEYSAPIFLNHIPLYRSNDSFCDYPSSMQEKVKKNNLEGEDAMHEVASKFLLSRLKPRLVLSGHTHMDCITNHINPNNQDEPVKEFTISSYNHKYAEKRPSFLLLSANSTHIFTRHCYLVEEWIIISIYIINIFMLLYSVGRHCASTEFDYQPQ